MAELKWKKLYTNENYEMWMVKTTLGDCYIRHGFRKNDWNYGVGAFTYSEDVTDFDSAKTACQTDHDARVKAIAEANGYVKIDPSETVVRRADLRELLIAFGPGVGYEGQQNAFERLGIAMER